MSTPKPKFLVIHPDPTNINEVIRKINFQNSKIGPFAAVILLGNVNCESVETTPDVPVYYMMNTDKNENLKGSDMNTESKLIGVKVPFFQKLQCGVSMAFVDTQSHKPDPKSLVYTGTLDLMFSYYWPLAIASDHRLTLVGNRNLDPIVQALRPRYHFATGSERGRYLENAPFAWTDERVCRFISLGREKSGLKWFYAFGLGVEADDTHGCVANPFHESKKREISQEASENEELSITKRLRRNLNSTGHPLPARQRPRVSPESCFFCLSNPKVETHMIVAIGKLCYLTIAKGPLTLPSETLNFSGHGIIIPIDHTPTAELREDTIKEIERFQESLALTFLQANHSVVYFEISRPENIHFHIQAVPIPKQLMENFERALKNKQKLNNENFSNTQKLNFTNVLPGDAKLTEQTCSPYVRFTIYENLQLLRYYISPLLEKKELDLQFPRRVLAYLLKAPKRQNWHRCRQTLAEETAECTKFKEFYEKFDCTKD